MRNVSAAYLVSAHRLPHSPRRRRRRLVRTSLSSASISPPKPGSVPGLVQLYLNNHYLHLRFDIFCLVHDINLLLLYNHFNFVLVAHVRHSQTCLPLHSLNHNFLAIYNIHTALLHGGHFATHEVIDDYWLLAIGCWLHVVN